MRVVEGTPAHIEKRIEAHQAMWKLALENNDEIGYDESLRDECCLHSEWETPLWQEAQDCRGDDPR